MVTAGSGPDSGRMSAADAAGPAEREARRERAATVVITISHSPMKRGQSRRAGRAKLPPAGVRRDGH